MVAAFKRLRAEVGRRRHRHLELALTQIDQRFRASEQLTNGRIDAVDAELRAQCERAVRLRAPALWNDLWRDLEPPLATPLALLSERDDPDGAIAESIARLGSPQRAELERFGIERIREHARSDACPIPAPADRERYFAEHHLAYWISGLGDALWLSALAERHGADVARGRLLDFGCASGRVLRHFAAFDVGAELLGFDIQPQAVRWARKHLVGPVIALTTVIPALPVPDRSVDLVYAGSVFTHIDDFEEATLLELRRVLKPDGIAVITIHPGRIWEDMRRRDDHVVRRVVTGVPHRCVPPGIEPVTSQLFERELPGERVVLTAVDWPVNNTNVIHSHEYIRRRWGAIFTIEDVVERAHGNHQDALVLRVRP